MKEEKKYIQILFFRNDIEIGIAKYIDIIEESGLYNMNVMDLELVNNNYIDSLMDKEIEIKTYLNGDKLMLLTIIPQSYKSLEDGIISVTLKEIYTDELYTFYQEYLDIFRGWSNGVKYTWRDFKEEEKGYWLRCCNIWSGIPTSLELDKEYIINDEKDLKYPIDLHCLLSEIFFGERGYFGAEINAFIDCLLYLTDFIRNSNRECIVIINDFDDINRKMSKNKGYENYLIQISMELQGAGFKVITN